MAKKDNINNEQVKMEEENKNIDQSDDESSDVEESSLPSSNERNPIRHPFAPQGPYSCVPFGKQANLNIWLPYHTTPKDLFEGPETVLRARVVPIGQKYLTNLESDKMRAVTNDACPQINPWQVTKLAQCRARSPTSDDDTDDDGSGKPQKKRNRFDYPRGLLPPDDEEPIITENMLGVNDEFMCRRDENQVIEYCDVKLPKGEIRHLRDEGWLTDPILDLYLKLLSERSKSPSNSYPLVYCFGCYFYKSLDDFGLETVQLAADDVDLFSHKYLLFPAWEKHHWRLIVADVDKETLTAYNSAPTSDRKILTNIEEYLVEEKKRRNAVAKGGGDASSNNSDKTAGPDKWIKLIAKGGPQQKTPHDCGVFTLAFALYLCKQKEFNFKQENVPYFRERILYECISKRLI